MPLQKIRDFDPDYRNHFEGQDVIGYDLYSGTEKVGSVDDLLVDESGKIRYMIINTGAWIFGKKVLLPIGRSRIDYKGHRVAVDGLTRSQVEALPTYDGELPVDYEHEEKVRGVYRPMGMGTPAATGATAMGTAAVGTAAMGTAAVDTTTPLDYDRDTYAYDRDAALYDLDDTAHQKLRLYEERLIANKTRAKTGEVAVGKRVETETTKVSVPLEKERVVIERTTPSSASVAVGEGAFVEGEVARVEVYEEAADIRKEVDRGTVNAEETLRREELNIDTQGRPVVDKGTDTRRTK